MFPHDACYDFIRLLTMEMRLFIFAAIENAPMPLTMWLPRIKRRRCGGSGLLSVDDSAQHTVMYPGVKLHKDNGNVEQARTYFFPPPPPPLLFLVFEAIR